VSISFEEWEQRKRFVGFGPEDEFILTELHLVAKTYADEVMDELYARWLQFEELRVFFQEPGRLARVKTMQREYFIRLTRGDYGAEYLADRVRIGQVHRHVGLSPRWYMGAYSIYMQIVFPRVLAAFEYDRKKREQAIGALLKLISLDQEIALLMYFGEQDEAGLASWRPGGPERKASGQ
jgi:rsbT co-antagonist protein RsbR